jgi:hypothetical protein
LPSLFVAARGDAFFEHVPHQSQESAAAIFWPARWVTSGTATVDYRPGRYISWMVEYRHDQGERAMFFGRQVASPDGSMIPTQRAQNTVTLGATAWF